MSEAFLDIQYLQDEFSSALPNTIYFVIFLLLTHYIFLSTQNKVCECKYERC